VFASQATFSPSASNSHWQPLFPLQTLFHSLTHERDFRLGPLASNQDTESKASINFPLFSSSNSAELAHSITHTQALPPRILLMPFLSVFSPAGSSSRASQSLALQWLSATHTLSQSDLHLDCLQTGSPLFISALPFQTTQSLLWTSGISLDSVRDCVLPHRAANRALMLSELHQKTRREREKQHRNKHWNKCLLSVFSS